MHSTLSTCLLLAVLGGPLSKEDILGQADARIARHRTGEAVLRLLGPDGHPLPPGARVEIEQKRHAFLFGSNFFKFQACRTPEDNAAYEKHFADLLNFATLPFYWWGYERERDKPLHGRIERMVAWCKANDITTKAHPLVWNWVDPRWLPDDPDEVIRIQLQRIEREMAKFRGDIRIWDVVNEATHHDRPEPLSQAPKLSAAITKAGVGPFVRAAFRTARQVDPEAVLIINDYRVDQEFIDKVLRELVDDDGEPLYDVIGIQSHQHGGAWPVEMIWEVCERFVEFGKPLHFTETTFLSGELGWDLKKHSDDPDFVWASTPEGEERQAREVVTFYTVLFSHPAVEAITWWDFTDQGSWQRAPSGFLRDDMTPKPAYHALRELIREKWWTRTEGASTGEAGRFAFTGFYGDYEVRWMGDTIASGTFSFDAKTREPIEVRLKHAP